MKKKIVLALIAGTLFTACSQKDKGITGTWYGLKYGAPMTVEINDSVISIFSEASSNITMHANYSIEKTGENTFNIDMGGVMGMSGQGFGVLDGEELEIATLFGPKEYVQRPASVEDLQGNPASMVLNLSRNKSKFKSVIDEEVEAPESAKLAFERNKRLGHGINLNNVVDGNSHMGNPPDQPFTDFDAKRIADAGFKSVRLATCWVKHSEPTAPYTIDPEFFKKVDGIVDLCLKHGLAVSIDVHYYPYINMTNPDPVLTFDENIDRLSYLWEQIADHYKDYSNDLVFFDLLNEPAPTLDVDRYNDMIANLIGVVRKTNPDRTILIGTPSLGQHWTIGELRFPENEWNIIAECHYYLPHTFTHQGLGYAGVADVHGTKWTGTDAERAPILKDFAYLAKWSKMQNRPVNIGEFGVNDEADLESRARYLKFMRDNIDANGMSFHLWGYRECFHIMDLNTGTWEETAIKALNY